MEQGQKFDYFYDLLAPYGGKVTIGDYKLDYEPMVGSISFTFDDPETETTTAIYCTPFWEHHDGVVIQKMVWNPDDEEIGDIVVIPITLQQDDHVNLTNFLLLMEAYMRANGLANEPYKIEGVG
jgi:hypothetical protein